jgi:adenosylhomocysteinase
MGQIDWVYCQLTSTREAIENFSSVVKTNSKILICSHLEAKLVAFSRILHEKGFEVHLVSNLPSSIKTDLLPEIYKIGLNFYDTSKLSFEESEEVIGNIINNETFDFVFDDGAHTYSKMKSSISKTVFTEFTQSGVNQALKLSLNSLVINLNSSYTKRVIGNIYGTGISTLAAIQTITNISFQNLEVGIIGLGPIGLSCALAFKEAGSRVGPIHMVMQEKC